MEVGNIGVSQKVLHAEHKASRGSRVSEVSEKVKKRLLFIEREVPSTPKKVRVTESLLSPESLETLQNSFREAQAELMK
ncbi:hypothetical protein N9Y92_01015 [Chlamydiales bacterium]|nr:hypothetical protein [Chlamydiales bacterium]